VRALTVRQPWAWAIAHGGKLIENRTDCKSYTGELLIHAGAKWSTRGQHDERILQAWGGPMVGPDRVARRLVHPSIAGDSADREIRFGEIVAVAELVECHRDEGCCRPWGESSYVEAGGAERHELSHLVFENVRPIYNGPCLPGRMGLWKPHVETIRDVLEQLSEQDDEPYGACPRDPDGLHHVGCGC
jgi:hypothetical protein